MEEAKKAPLFRLVRHRENGGREVLADDLEIPAADVGEINKALVRTMYRLWDKPKP